MYLIYIIPLIKSIYFLLLMLQLDHYKISSIKNYLLRYYFKLPFIVITYLSIFLLLKNTYLNILIYIFIIVFSLIKQNYVIKLKFTKRLIRLLLLILLVSTLLIFIKPSIEIFLILLYTLPILVFLCNLIVQPIENYIKHYYKSKTTKKLIKINPYTICITGSYGKTSIKEMLYNIYKDKYICFKTKSSYNTPMGIAKSVLNEMNILTELFFVEAGATTVGDIREITNIVHPNIGVITSIGPQHLNTFKTMNNVLKTKLELSDSLPPDGKLILNYHNQYLNGLVNKNIKETLTANSPSLHARNIVHHDIYTEFDIYSYNKCLTHVKTKLLGELFIHNIIICYAVKLALDELYPLSNDEFQTNMLQLTNPLHRLSTYEITKNNTIYRFIDDSFNSNTEGFIQAVKVLKHLNGLKVLITPGIVDSGKHSKMIAEYLTPNLKELDDIVLVNNKEIKYLKQALLNNNINYYLVNSFNEALNYIYNKYSDFNMEVVNILLENDLPDNYLMRW